MFQAKQYGEKKCMICGKQTKGLVVAFDDGSLNGFLCFKDIMKAAEHRAEEQQQANPANGQPVPLR